MDNRESQVIILLSDLIMSGLRAIKSEETYPSRSQDDSEDFLKGARAKVNMLRGMRERFEDEMS